MSLCDFRLRAEASRDSKDEVGDDVSELSLSYKPRSVPLLSLADTREREQNFMCIKDVYLAALGFVQ